MPLCNADEHIVTLTRLTDMWMGDICVRRCDADIVILFIEFWGCGHRMLNSAKVIFVCRDVGINDTFLFGELLEYKIVLEVVR